MNTIQLQGDISFEQYQMAVNALEAIGLEVEKPLCKPRNIVETDEIVLTQEDLVALEQSKKEDEQGLYMASEEVYKKALAVCIK